MNEAMKGADYGAWLTELKTRLPMLLVFMCHKQQGVVVAFMDVAVIQSEATT